MANKRKGQTVAARDWVQHLRPFGKRDFWGQQRQDDKRIIQEQLHEADDPFEDFDLDDYEDEYWMYDEDDSEWDFIDGTIDW